MSAASPRDGGARAIGRPPGGARGR